MKTLKLIKRLFLLCLIMAGTQNAWADNQYVYAGTRTEGNLRFDIYHQYNYVNVLYATSIGDIAVLKGITGTAEEVTIPAHLEEPGVIFGIPVLYANGTISNSYVKNLTFTGSISFFGNLKGYVNEQAPDVEIEGHLNCPNLNTITFKGNGDGSGLYEYETETTTVPPLQCPNLTDIYFQASSAPTFESKIVIELNNYYTIPVTWEQICTAPASNVTAHVAAWTQEECDQMHLTANVYKQLKAVVHYKEGENLVTVTASVSDGAIFQAEDYGVLSGDMIKSKDIDKSSSLTFYVYPSSDDIVIDHVYVNDTDVKNQMTTTSDGKKQYTLEGEVMQDDVVIRVVGARKVKITVSVEEAGAGNGVMFKYNNSEYIYGRGTKTYTKVMHIDYTFYVADGNKATIKNVFVNGEDVYQDMVEVTDSENPFYDASNVRKYTIENVNSDITIRITSEETVDHYTLYVGSGGKIEFDFDNAHQSCANNNYCQFAFNKSQTLTVTATPDEGYEFESFLFEGTKLDTDMGEWITMETQADGKFVVNLALGTYQMPYTDNSYVVAFTFKKASSPKLKITMVNGSGGKMSIGLTYNGQPAAERWIGGGDAFSITTLEKAKLGEEFTLTAIMEPGRKNMGVRINGYPCPIESSAGDTLHYNLGNLKEFGDSVVITSLYQDLADFSKSRIHIKSKGSAGELARWALRDVTKKRDVFNEAVADMPVLDRIDTLDVNTQYCFTFYGSTANLKHVMINGEEVELTGTLIKRTPNRILRSLDDEILIEFHDNTNVSAYASNGTVAMKKITSEGVEEPLGGGLAYSSKSIKPSDGVKIFFIPNNGAGELKTLLVNYFEIDLENDSRVVLESDGTYSFTLSATQVQDFGGDTHQIQVFGEFEGGSAGTSYDLNHDGQVNITDVIILVNRILGND